MTSGDELADALCARVVQYMKTYENVQWAIPNNLVMRAELAGTMHGLREALCLLKGWDLEEAEHEGRADTFVRDWHNNTFPREEAW